MNFGSLATKIPARYQPYLPYALPIVASVIGLGIALLLLLPNINDIVTIKAQADADQTKETALGAKAKALQSLDQAKLTSELVNTSGAIPSDKDVAGFLGEFNLIAGKAGAVVDTAQLVTSAAKGEKNSLDFQVIIKGSYANIKGFLTSIETARRVMIVKSISVNVSEDKKLSADMTITGYFEPLANISANLEDPLPERTATQEKLLVDLQKRTIYAAPTSTTPSVSGRSDPFSGL